MNLLSTKSKIFRWGWPKRRCQSWGESLVEVKLAEGDTWSLWATHRVHVYSGLLPAISEFWDPSQEWKKFDWGQIVSAKHSNRYKVFFYSWSTELESTKLELEALSWVKPVWVMGIVLPSPMETSSLSDYSSRLFDSVLTWWVAPESRIQRDASEWWFETKLTLASKWLCDFERHTSAVGPIFWQSWHFTACLGSLPFYWFRGTACRGGCGLEDWFGKRQLFF